MAQLYSNNAITTLAVGCSAVATSITLTSSLKFPVPTGSDYFLITVFQISGVNETNHEVMKVTANNTGTGVLTVVRQFEDPATMPAFAFSTGDQVQLRMTAGSLDLAARVTNVPAGGIASTTVQAAINELDTEKAPVAGSTSNDFSVKILTADNAINGKTGANIASASTINLTTATGNLVHITGTTTITAVTLAAGMHRKVIFDGVLTLTHHATNNDLPGKLNITTAAGDRAIYVSDGTTVTCVSFTRANGVVFADISDLAQDLATTTGLTYGYKKGKYRDSLSSLSTKTASTIALTDNNNNYVELSPGGTVSASITGFGSYGYPMAIVVTSGGAITSVIDTRFVVGHELLVNRDSPNGYPSLSTYKITFKNASAGATSFLTHANTNPRTYTFPDVTGTVVVGGAGIGTSGAPFSLPNATYVPIVGANLAIGNTDLYTVPASRKVVIFPAGRVYNPSAGSITVYHQVKISGTYYPIGTLTTLTTLTGGSSTHSTVIILGAGEIFSVNTTTTAGLNIRLNAIEFDDTETRLLTARILALASGNNTLLTVPALKSAVPVGANLVVASNTNTGPAIANFSGGSLNYYINHVPSGGSVSSTNQLGPATAWANQTSTFYAGTASSAAAGDFYNINASGAGGFAWLTYYLLP